MDLRDRVQASLSGTYTLERELGGGGMSRVFVASEDRFGRKVVVKVLAPELAAALSTERFEREIQLAASLQQANIVPVLSAGETEGLPYYTMPFVEGESLRARLGRGPLSIAEAVATLRDVARALAYAHDRGVVHRDIKPDNVLISGGTAVVTDFGIAKAIAAAQARPTSETLTQLGTAVGTPAYMAPEQAAGDPSTDHRADIYAFGCTAFELLAGHAPFYGRAPHKLIAAHMGEVPPSLMTLRPDCPPALARLVMQCLEKDAAHRPGSADDLIRLLDAVSSVPADAAPAILMARPGMLWRALAIYAAAFAGVAAVARILVDRQGFPEWVFTGALIVMALGLPAILFTGYTHFIMQRVAAATPTFTPRGVNRRPSAEGTLANLAVRASSHVSWQRTARGGMLAMGAFALVVVAYLGSRALGVGPFGSLMSAGKLAAQDEVLVAAFDAAGADSSLGLVVSEAVRTNLLQSSAVKIVPTSTIVGALQRMQRAVTERVDLGLARDIAAREGIEAIVTGSIVPAGSGYIITTRLVLAATGDELASYHEVAAGPGEIMTTVDALTKQLRSRIGDSLKDVADAPPLHQVTTPSLAALQSFANGLRANDIEGDYDKAITFFEDAVAKDSLFASAYVQLAHSLGNARRDPALRDSALASAFRLRERLPDRERYAIEAVYYSSGAALNRPKAFAAFERAIELDSGNVDALNSFAILANNVRDYERAERLYRRATAIDPGNGIIQGNLVSLLVNRGKYADADSVMRFMEERKIPFPTTSGRARIAYNRRQYDSAEAIARPAARNLAAPLGQGSANALYSLMLARGRLREAERIGTDLAGYMRSRGFPRPPLLDSMESAMADGWHRGDTDRARRRLDAALRAHGAVDGEWTPLLLQLGLAYAVVQAPERARELIARFDAQADSAMRRDLHTEREDALGEIALAENRPRDAMAHFRRADRELDGLPASCAFCLDALLGRAFDLADMPDSAITHFERYLVNPAGARLSMDAWLKAPILKRLGELHEARGDYSRAASYYAWFLELWNRADPDLLPRVREVERALRRVQDRIPR